MTNSFVDDVKTFRSNAFRDFLKIIGEQHFLKKIERLTLKKPRESFSTITDIRTYFGRPIDSSLVINNGIYERHYYKNQNSDRVPIEVKGDYFANYGSVSDFLVIEFSDEVNAHLYTDKDNSLYIRYQVLNIDEPVTKISVSLGCKKYNIQIFIHSEISQTLIFEGFDTLNGFKELYEKDKRSAFEAFGDSIRFAKWLDIKGHPVWVYDFCCKLNEQYQIPGFLMLSGFDEYKNKVPMVVDGFRGKYETVV